MIRFFEIKFFLSTNVKKVIFSLSFLAISLAGCRESSLSEPRQERHRPLPTVRPAASRVERVPGRKTWALVLLLAAPAFLRSLRVMTRADMDRPLLKPRANAPARAPEACPGTNGVALLGAPVRAGEAVWAVVVGGALAVVAAGVAVNGASSRTLSAISK